MSGITSHVLDTSRGVPAEGIPIVLEFQNESGDWESVSQDTTDSDGRVQDLTGGSSRVGHYRISFLVSDYFAKLNVESFYPVIRIEFSLTDNNQHYHVPVLLNPFGYSTYRGS
jgi:5-hydroxyisourate hydrolase